MYVGGSNDMARKHAVQCCCVGRGGRGITLIELVSELWCVASWCYQDPPRSCPPSSANACPSFKIRLRALGPRKEHYLCGQAYE
jgi:hypothetical protein